MNRPVIGADVGRSAVKVVFSDTEGKKSDMIFGSVVVPAVAISDVREAARAAAETIEVNGKKYFTGKTAEFQGDEKGVSGLINNWIDTDEHTALLLSTMKRIKDRGVSRAEEAILVLGLPAKSFHDQKDRLKDIAKELFPKCAIYTVPQPFGPYYEYQLSEDGGQANGRSLSNDSVAVIDVGRYSTDFLLIEKGHFIESHHQSVGGTTVAIESLRKLVKSSEYKADISELEAEQCLLTKKLLNFGEEIDISHLVEEAYRPFTAEVTQKAKSLFDTKARKLHAIVVAGGASPLIGNERKEEWSNIVISERKRMSIAEGFYRFGRTRLNSNKA